MPTSEEIIDKIASYEYPRMIGGQCFYCGTVDKNDHAPVCAWWLAKEHQKLKAEQEKSMIVALLARRAAPVGEDGICLLCGRNTGRALNLHTLSCPWKRATVFVKKELDRR